jgi:AcrR family transcriptional regulator
MVEPRRQKGTMSATTKRSYHHGDLRAALLSAAMDMLEHGEPFSIRAVARRAGVSPTAPYRHFPDREALESALAAQGLRDLKADLIESSDLPVSLADLAELGVAYVNFALQRPALFRLMFGNECDEENIERVQAAAAVHDLLGAAVANVFPDADPRDLALAGWGLVHGLACLYLDRKLTAATMEDISTQVRRSLIAVFGARSEGSAVAELDRR